jgi:hypothetical protein
LNGAAIAAFLAVVAVGINRGWLTTRGLLLGVRLGLAAVLVATAASYAAWAVIKRGRPATPPKFYQGSPEIAAMLAALGIVAALIVYLPFLRRAKLANLAVGGLFWWLMLADASAIALPGGTYLFLWPLVFGLLAVAISGRMPDSMVGRVATYLGAVPALVLMSTTIQSLCVALGPTSPFVTAPAAALLVVALVPLLGKLVGGSSPPVS